jgi:hypothetical protein
MDTQPEGTSRVTAEDTDRTVMATEGDTPPDAIATETAGTEEPSVRSRAEPTPATGERSGVRFPARSGDLLEIGVMLLQEAEDLLKGSRKKRIKFRLGNKTLAEVPLTTGALGVLATVMLGVALTRLTIDVE